MTEGPCWPRRAWMFPLALPAWCISFASDHACILNPMTGRFPNSCARASLFSLIILLAGCGGGSAGLSPSPGVSPRTTAPPTSPPSVVSVSVGQATTTSAIPIGATGAAVSVGVPGVPSASGSGSMQISTSTTLPSGIAPFGKSHAASRTISSLDSLLQSASIVGYVTFTDTSGTFSFTLTPSISLTVPSNTSAGTQFFLAALAPGSSIWVAPLAGPTSATQSGTVTFDSEPGNMTFTQGQTYTFAVLAQTNSQPLPPPSESSASVSQSNGGTISLSNIPLALTTSMTLTISGNTVSATDPFSLTAAASDDHNQFGELPVDLASWPNFAPVVYFQLYANALVNFSSTPAITVSGIPANASTCHVDAYIGYPSSWVPVIGGTNLGYLEGSVQNGTITIPAMSAYLLWNGLINLSAGPNYFAIACH